MRRSLAAARWDGEPEVARDRGAAPSDDGEERRSPAERREDDEGPREPASRERRHDLTERGEAGEGPSVTWIPRRDELGLAKRRVGRLEAQERKAVEPREQPRDG